MHRLGMTTEEVPGVEEVIVRTKTKEHVFRSPDVTILTVQGTKTYQVVGNPENPTSLSRYPLFDRDARARRESGGPGRTAPKRTSTW